MTTVFICGNGNTSWTNFLQDYVPTIELALSLEPQRFIVCDFRGTDTLAMEYLKYRTGRVTVYHFGERPRYFPDKFRTLVGEWTLVGGYTNDSSRDLAAMEVCTHFIAFDDNSDDVRKSGTLKNIEHLLKMGRLWLKA